MAERTADALRQRALSVLGDGDGRFERRLAAVIRHAGWEGRELRVLTADEAVDVDDVLDRIAAGTHITFLRASGEFEVRRVVKPAKSRRGWGSGQRKIGAPSQMRGH